jgi:hypothetical protein
MLVSLSEHELTALARALDYYLVELSQQAARSEQREVESDLWQLQRTLEQIRQRLHQIEQAERHEQ